MMTSDRKVVAKASTRSAVVIRKPVFIGELN